MPEAPRCIPGTSQISLPTTLHEGSEIFAFGIQALNNPTCADEFIANLDDHLPNAILSNTHLETINQRVASGLANTTPLIEARKFLKKYRQEEITTSGELGEILLYIFAKEVKGAKKLISKFMNRERRSRNILGRDSIFGFQGEDGNIYMLMGESKIRGDSNDGLREAQSDINTFWQSPADIDHEVQLASAHIRDEITEDSLPIYEAYFVEGSTKFANLKFKNIIFVGYSFDKLQELIDGTIDNDGFATEVITDLQRCFTNQKTLIESCEHPGIFCFLPFKDVEQARLTFAQRHNLITT